ncbi:class I adenylate-forming enzyme family protein [Halovenus halobia]|uniref:class I adenylate-forming enzyme family protein n=1 Tax=Halovenus halobia TaxID=3396622 RepID=UPI003F567C35
MNFANFVDRAAGDRPEATALTDPQRELSFAALSAETDRFAGALAELGVDPGDRVALYLPNSTVFLAAYFGAMKRGAIPFPINMRFEGEEIEYVLDDAGASTVVTHGQFEDVIDSLDVNSLEQMIVADGERGHSYTDLVQTSDPIEQVYPRKQDELAELVYTSGTTGRPKGVKHTHGNLSANAHGLITYMDWTHRETTLTVCPCFHVSGLNVTSTPFVVAGAENHFLPQWDPETALSVMDEQSVTYVFLIPTMAIDLLRFDGLEEYDLSALETIGVGGSPMPKERIEAVEETFDVTLLEGYGMTETTPLAAINRPDQDVYQAGSIGPVAEEVVDVRIEDPNSGEAVETGEKGELLWHGDTITPGYYNLPEKNEQAFVERAGKRWLRSGDIGRMDEHGHLFVEDRIDDMIISGGENVYPREIEDVIYELDGVAEAAVIGSPHDRLGEQVTAIVVADDAVTVEDIETVVRGQLADYKIPRRVEFVDELPKTSTRKIDKVSLRERF